jgi:hypothetical protein
MRQVYKPRGLRQDLSIQQVGEETLVYDQRRHQAFCLNPVSSAVWMHCDGTQSVAQIAATLSSASGQPVAEEVVDLALAQMKENGLLEPHADLAAEASFATLGPISRRSMMARVGAGAVVMLPAIAMVLAPRPADASGGGGVGSYQLPDQGNNPVRGLRRLSRRPGAGK